MTQTREAPGNMKNCAQGPQSSQEYDKNMIKI